jgi:hypothetical protein
LIVEPRVTEEHLDFGLIFGFRSSDSHVVSAGRSAARAKSMGGLTQRRAAATFKRF